jgi:integrase
MPTGKKDARREKVKKRVWKRTDSTGAVTFEIAYTDSDGVRRRETAGPREKDADALLAQKDADKSRGLRVRPPARLCVRDAAETWYAATAHLRDTTRAAYRASLDTHVLPAFGGRRLDAVTPDDVARWAAHARTLTYRREVLARKHADPKPRVPYRAKTIGLALRTLGRVYVHARRRQGYVGTSPVAELERAERPTDDPKPRIVLTPDEIEQLIAAATSTYRMAIAFIAHTGVRDAEARGLPPSNLNLRERTVSVTVQLTRKGAREPLKTPEARRTIELPGVLVAMLREHLLAGPDTSDDAYVFTTSTGRPLDHGNLTRGLARACERAGLPVISPHALRHAHASTLIAEGWDLVSVQQRLGHATPAITAAIYLHEFRAANRRQERLDRLDGLYGADPEQAPGQRQGNARATENRGRVRKPLPEPPAREIGKVIDLQAKRRARGR